MATAKDHLDRKRRQAEFFHEKMGADQFELECYFTAFLTAWKSIVYYIERHMTRKAGTKKKDRIEHWAEAHLTADQVEMWRALMGLRDDDVHQEPITTGRSRSGFAVRTFQPRSPSALTRFVVTDPRTGKRYGVKGLCDTGLVVARRMIAEYHTM